MAVFYDYIKGTTGDGKIFTHILCPPVSQQTYSDIHNNKVTINASNFPVILLLNDQHQLLQNLGEIITSSGDTQTLSKPLKIGSDNKYSILNADQLKFVNNSIDEEKKVIINFNNYFLWETIKNQCILKNNVETLLTCTDQQISSNVPCSFTDFNATNIFENNQNINELYMKQNQIVDALENNHNTVPSSALFNKTKTELQSLINSLGFKEGYMTVDDGGLPCIQEHKVWWGTLNNLQIIYGYFKIQVNYQYANDLNIIRAIIKCYKSKGQENLLFKQSKNINIGSIDTGTSGYGYIKREKNTNELHVHSIAPAKFNETVYFIDIG